MSHIAYQVQPTPALESADDEIEVLTTAIQQHSSVEHRLCSCFYSNAYSATLNKRTATVLGLMVCKVLGRIAQCTLKPSTRKGANARVLAH